MKGKLTNKKKDKKNKK